MSCVWVATIGVAGASLLLFAVLFWHGLVFEDRHRSLVDRLPRGLREWLFMAGTDDEEAAEAGDERAALLVRGQRLRRSFAHGSVVLVSLVLGLAVVAFVLCAFGLIE